MEMKYYNASNNFKAPIPREPKPYTPPKQVMEPVIPMPAKVLQINETKEPPKIECHDEKKPQNIFQNFGQDELLILGLIFLLILNSCDDYLLLMVLAFLFLSGTDKH